MVNKLAKKKKKYQKRKLRSKRNLKISADRPRLVVFRSSRYLYLQLIDDFKRTVICSVSSLSTDLKSKNLGKGIDSAKVLGSEMAKRVKNAGFDKVAFDRNGFLYHGKIKAIADAMRENGIGF